MKILRILIPLQLYRLIRRRQGLFFRLILCWLIGLLALKNDEMNRYDLRFQLRGDQKPNTEIVLLLLKPSDLSRIYDLRTHSLVTLNEVTDVTDSFFWDKKLWTHLLQVILKADPKAVGVTLYFGDNIGGPIPMEKLEMDTFMDPRIFWSTTMSSVERVLVPSFANKEGSNVGSNGLDHDDDGIIRRWKREEGDLPHLAEKIAGIKLRTENTPSVINYRGSHNVFTTYNLTEVFSGDLPAEAFKNKYIIIGAESSVGGQLLTPVGPMNRAEVIAHIVDNLTQHRWVQRLPVLWSVVFFALITIFSALLIVNYPQSVSLIFFLCLGLLTLSISAWIFDTVFLWVPGFSTLFLMATVWFVVVGYQASQIERKNFLLQQEQKNLQEMEQLKNNFVSLISHDLKTPIAKIQAIIERRLRESPELTQQAQPLYEDLMQLYNCGDELNKYIQSILKLLRVESRDYRLNKEVEDLNSIIEEALKQLTPLAEAKKINFQSQLEPLFSIEFDVTLIKEVLINLIENAIKYSEMNKTIEITSKESNGFAIVTIADEGPGIAPDDLPKVFGKFVRGKDQDLKTKGTGLGLYLVKYFIELHGGQVEISSQLGQGTKVSFTLPVDNDIGSG